MGVTVLADRASETPRQPAPPDAPRTASAGKVPRPVLLKQRQRRRRFLMGFTLFTAASVFLTGSAYVYIQHRIGQIDRVSVPGLVGDEVGQVMNVLLVGSDSRDRLEGAAAVQAGKGKVGGARSDAIMLLHIDPRHRQAAILSIPRDLWVPIAGTEFSDKINASFALGGAPQLVATVQQALGLIVNHYVQVDFVGFKDIVDTVGGVDLYTPTPARDFTSGLDIPRGGCVRLDGTQGLAFVRSRDYEVLVDGRWQADPRGDLGRIRRQQEFIRRMMRKALSSGLTNPVQLNRLIGIGVNDVTIDSALSSKDITTLARRFSDLDADSVALLTLPTAPAGIPGVWAEKLLPDESRPILDRMNGTAPVAGNQPQDAPATTAPPGSRDPAAVGVRVLNGAGTPGVAAKAATALEGAGFTIAGTPGDAESRAARTVVRHAPGQLAKAQLLERYLQAGATLQEDVGLRGADVALVVGSDYAGLRAQPAPPPDTTATTVDAGLTPASLPEGTVVPPPC